MPTGLYFAKVTASPSSICTRSQSRTGNQPSKQTQRHTKSKRPTFEPALQRAEEQSHHNHDATDSHLDNAISDVLQYISKFPSRTKRKNPDIKETTARNSATSNRGSLPPKKKQNTFKETAIISKSQICLSSPDIKTVANLHLDQLYQRKTREQKCIAALAQYIKNKVTKNKNIKAHHHKLKAAIKLIFHCMQELTIPVGSLDYTAEKILTDIAYLTNDMLIASLIKTGKTRLTQKDYQALAEGKLEEAIHDEHVRNDIPVVIVEKIAKYSKRSWSIQQLLSPK